MTKSTVILVIEDDVAPASGDSVLSDPLRSSVDAAGASCGAIYRLDSDGGLSLETHLGFPDAVAAALGGFFGHSAWLRDWIENGPAATVPNPDWCDLLRRAQARSLIVAPLALDGSRGALVLCSDREQGVAGALCLSNENQHYLARIIQTLAEGMAILDCSGRFIFCNAAAEKTLGLPASEILKRTYNDPAWKMTTVDGRHFPEQDQPFVRVMQTGEPVYDVEQVIERPDGEKVILSINSAPLRDASGAITGTVRSITDITARKRAEETLLRRTKELARSNAELEEFAYVVAHDLKEPLRTVTSFTQLLAQRYRGRLDAGAGQLIDRAVGGARRMQQLIDDLPAYSRVTSESKHLVPVGCETVFQQALSQLFQNLIGNALKFHAAEPSRVHVSAERKGGKWVFAIRDNGIGIDPEHTDRIFAVFQRLHGDADYPGTGIGLAICKKIVEQHGGRIWVESEPGKGSTFYFTLGEANRPILL